MGEQRIDAGKAIESLAWQLNFFPGQTMSYNSLAQATGLAWATARKYAQLLEQLQKVMPALELTEDGVKVSHTAGSVAHIPQDPMAAAGLYLFMHGYFTGNPAAELNADEHLAFIQRYTEGLNGLAAAGMARKEGKKWKLLSPGIAFSGSLYSDILKAVGPPITPREVLSDDLKTYSHVRPLEFQPRPAPERRHRYAMAAVA